MADFVPAFGRWEDPEHTEEFFGNQPIPISKGISWGQDDNADVNIIDDYERVNGRKWDSLNQNPDGFCVGFNTAKCATLSLSVANVQGDVAIEPLYGGMRYEIGFQRHGSNLNRSGDGGVGTWAAELVTQKWFYLKQRYQNVDFSTYSRERCKEYGKTGVPDSIELPDGQQVITNSVLVPDGAESWKMLGQKYPLVCCSNQGFEMKRDSKGICKPVGNPLNPRDSSNWPHCNPFPARYTLKGNVPVLLYDNSWGFYLGESMRVLLESGAELILTGAQFLVPLEVIDRMARQGREMFAFYGQKGLVANRPYGFI